MTESATSSARGGKSLLRRIMRSRATFFILGVLALLAVLNVNRILPSGDLEPGELIILSGNDDSIGGQRDKLLAQWNASHPRNRARFKPASSNADHQHSAMVADAQDAGSDVDIYNLDVTWVTEFASAGYIRRLESADSTGFLEAPWKTGQFRGEQYALPFNTDAGLLYYRTDIMPEAKDIPQQLPPTPAEVQKMLQRSSDLKAGFATQLATYEGLTVNALEAIWAANGEVVGDDGRLVPDLTLANAGLQRLANGLKTSDPLSPGGLLPGSLDADELKTTEAFAAGQVALMRNWPVAYDRLKELAKQQPNGFDITGKYSVRALPASVLGGQDLAISHHTKQPRAAEALIQFLTSETSEIKLYLDGGLAPTRLAAYENVEARNKHTPEFTDTLRTAVERARQRPITPHYQLFSNVFQGLVAEAIEGNGILRAGAHRDLANALDGKLE